MCPSPWQMYSVICYYLRLHLQMRVFCLLWTAQYLAQLEASSGHCKIIMSDSSIEERPPVDRPAGPPTPLPVQAQRDAAHRISAAVAQELNFRGEALCYIRWDINSMSRLVISLRGMRPHEREHPNILVCRDSPPMDADEDWAGAEAEEAEEEAGHVSSEHGDDVRTAYEASDPEAAATAPSAPSGPVEPPMPPPNFNRNAPPAQSLEVRTSRVNRIINQMEAEGRSLMNEAEINALHDEFAANPLEDNAALSYEALFEDDMEGGEIEDNTLTEREDMTSAAAASSAPPGTRATPQPKPRGNGYRKLRPHFLLQAMLCFGQCALLLSRVLKQTCTVSAGESMTSEGRAHLSWRQVAPSIRLCLLEAPKREQQWPSRAKLRFLRPSSLRFGPENVRSSVVLLLALGYKIAYFWLQRLVRYSVNGLDLLKAGNLIAWRNLIYIQRVLFRLLFAVRTCGCREYQKDPQTSSEFFYHASGAKPYDMPGSSSRSTSARWIGPKSDRASRCMPRAIFTCLLLFLACIQPCQSARTDVRVGGPATVPPEVPSGTKPRGLREASVPTQEHSDKTRITKRTYGRAYAKAARQGGSFYRGKWREFQWFQKTRVGSVQLPRQKQADFDMHSIRTMTWNAGGLTKPVLQELETYARDMHLDVLHIQETKWSEDYQWSGPDYVYIHSAGHNKQDKVGGLLTMVSTRIASDKDVQYNHVWAGRLLHVRVPAGNASLDLLNVYQYSANDKPGTLARRQQFLQKLQRALAGLPRRNALIMSGDLNTSCEPLSHVCGQYVLPVGEYHKQDYKDFLHICEALSLTILNTWTQPTHGQLATFQFGQLSSQIDFVIVRRAQASNTARRAAVVEDYPVAKWRAGANHFPVMAHVPVPKRRWRTSPQTPACQVDLQGVLHDLHREPQAPRLEAFRAEVANRLTSDADFDSTVLQVAILYYPRPPRPERAPTQPEELANSARHMWQLFRQMRSCKFHMQGVVQAWKLWVRFSQAHRIHKQRAINRAKVKRDDLLQQAQQAAEAGNVHQVWKVVKTMAPKTRFRKVQLYQNGQIMAPEAELDWIARAFGDRCGSSHSTTPPPLQRQHPPLHIDETEVRVALRQIPARKAVPPQVLPSAFWKACADQVAGPLTQAINREWQAEQVWIRQNWADADVALLPKGQKQAKTPLDLRPIGLQHPLGKTLMKVLVSQARAQIADLVKRWPQTAYVPGRSTTTALKVVMSHCAAVRQGCAMARTTLHQKYEGQTSAVHHTPLRGGLQVSLDLTAAFDLVNWSHLREALALAQIDPSVQELLLQWLRQVVYQFTHRGQKQKVRPSWGLRQGCPASPVLWSVFTALLCQAFDQRLTAGWATQHAVMYADDSHLRWQFDTYAGFERALTELRIIMRIFSRFDMCINCKKTQAILLLSGHDKHRVHKHYVRTHPEGKRLLLLPGDPSRWLPLVDKTEYLGLIIAYDRFEALSTRHRIAKANQRRWALASILHSRKFGIRYKLQIWRSCVQTTLLYGMHSFGLSPKLYQEITTTMMKHIRAIVSDQQHLTGNTHQDILERFKLADPLSQLCQAHHRELQLLGQDWMIQADWNMHITYSLLALRQGQQDAASSSEQECWACPDCDEVFQTAAALKIHAHRTHGRRDEPRPIFDRVQHAIGGLPTCRFCSKKFSRWQTLKQHINTMACKIFEPSHVESSTIHTEAADSSETKEPELIQLPTRQQTDAPPVAMQTSVKRAAGKGLNTLIPLKQLGRHLQQHCAVCGQWVASQKVMSAV